jgi:hypothetical protein
VIRGRSNGLKRYCCKGCGRTFNALTGTALARLRKKELWAAFAEGLSDGDTVKGAAERCGVAGSTSFRWRHRFLAAIKGGAVKLKGIVTMHAPKHRPADTVNLDIAHCPDEARFGRCGHEFESRKGNPLINQPQQFLQSLHRRLPFRHGRIRRTPVLRSLPDRLFQPSEQKCIAAIDQFRGDVTLPGERFGAGQRVCHCSARRTRGSENPDQGTQHNSAGDMHRNSSSKTQRWNNQEYRYPRGKQAPNASTDFAVFRSVGYTEVPASTNPPLKYALHATSLHRFAHPAHYPSG